MSLYQKSLRKALDLIKSHENFDPDFTAITGKEFSDTNKEYETVLRAINMAHQIERSAYCKAHPHHIRAVINGASEQECLRVFKEEGGLKYLENI